MTTQTSHPAFGGVESRITAAAAALRAGRLVVIPTETVYGIAANAASESAIRSLRALNEGAVKAHTWHAHSAAPVLKALNIAHPMHRRLFNRLAPGPIRFIVEGTPEEAAKAVAAMSVPAGVLDRAGEISVRIPDQPIAREVIERAGVPVVAERITRALGDGRALAAGAEATARGMGIEIVIDDGPTRLGKPSTAVRLKAGGDFRVEPGGVFDDRYIRRKVERTILFVCTGNTCRSPMAEAIARHLLSRSGPLPIPTKVASGGISAGNGAPMSPEAKDALRDLGIDTGPHRSHAVPREQIMEAEAVYAMTRSHLATLQDIAPAAADKMFLIDPAGNDVQDPIGGPIEEYRETARRLRDMIERRLKELDSTTT